jgi:hypothetical protein
MNLNFVSDNFKSPVPEKYLPCIGCDLALTLAQAACLLIGSRPGEGAPLCTSCLRRYSQSSVFASLVKNALTCGATVPSIRKCFVHWGLDDIPTVDRQFAKAEAVLARRKAARKGTQ